MDITDDRSLKSMRTAGTEASLSVDCGALAQGSLDTPSIITIQISHKSKGKPPRQKTPRDNYDNVILDPNMGPGAGAAARTEGVINRGSRCDVFVVVYHVLRKRFL
jgi:hypothetical protein